MGYKVKRHVSLPLLKFEVGVPRILQLTAAMHIGRELKSEAAKPEDKKKAPATLCDATDMETGEVGQIIVSAVVKSTLEEEYPNGGYVGKVFEITKRGTRAGKNYSDFTITEVEEDTAENDAGAPAAPTDKPASEPPAQQRATNSRRR